MPIKFTKNRQRTKEGNLVTDSGNSFCTVIPVLYKSIGVFFLRTFWMNSGGEGITMHTFSNFSKVLDFVRLHLA